MTKFEFKNKVYIYETEKTFTKTPKSHLKFKFTYLTKYNFK